MTHASRRSLWATAKCANWIYEQLLGNKFCLGELACSPAAMRGGKLDFVESQLELQRAGEFRRKTELGRASQEQKWSSY